MSDDPEYEEETVMAEVVKTPGREGVTVTFSDHMLDLIASSAANAVTLAASAKIDKLLAAKMDELFNEAFSARITAVAETAVSEWLSRPRRRTNMYGEVVAGDKTLAEEVTEYVAKWLSTRVEKDGREATYASDSKLLRWEWMTRRIVESDVKTAAEDAAKKVSEEAKRVVAASVGRYIADQLVPRAELPAPGGAR